MAHDKSKIIPAVLEDIQNGLSLRYACEKHKMSAANFLLWVDADPALAKQYARAREVQAEYYADEIIRIADSSQDAVKGRLQVDARKWIASKLLPKKFGDRIDMTSNGEKLPPVQIILPPADGDGKP